MTTPPTFEHFDHIHVYVANRSASERWYANVMGLKRVTALESWAVDGGPLTLGDQADQVHIALFERTTVSNRSTIALRVSAAEFLRWRTHLSQVLERSVNAVDHALSWSMYFADPDANPYEITSYEYDALKISLGQG